MLAENAPRFGQIEINNSNYKTLTSKVENNVANNRYLAEIAWLVSIVWAIKSFTEMFME